MKKYILISAVLTFFYATAVWAQNPTPEPDTLADPVQEGDPAVKQLPPQIDYVKDMDRVAHDKLPGPVRKTLESDERYADWQNAEIYQNKSGDQYVIQFKASGKTTTYRIDKNGRPVLDE
jgi:hypothetical protein